MRKTSPVIESARVEVRIDGVTYVYELEHQERRPIRGEIEVNVEEHEVPWYETGSFRVFEPGSQTASISLAGPLARATRQAPA